MNVFTCSVPVQRFHVRLNREATDALNALLLTLIRGGHEHFFSACGPCEGEVDLVWQVFFIDAAGAEQVRELLKSFGARKRKRLR